MKKRSKIWIVLLLVILFILGIFILQKFSKKPTYIEYIKLGQNCEKTLELTDNNQFIEQKLKIPYEMFYGVSLRIGTYGRENNSIYNLAIFDKTQNIQIASFDFNTSKANDNEYYELMLNSPKAIDNTHEFSIMIKAKTVVNNENNVAFYADSNQNIDNAMKVYYNNVPCDVNLCMNVYGGNSNQFWFIFTLMCEIYILILICYIAYLYLTHKPIIQNGLVQASLLGILVFTMLSVFSRMEVFSDEVDNIIGGMLIDKGSILYVDYYTAHTPFAYLLCSLFGIFQAGSVEQFRLLYYATVAILYMILYGRHKDNFGKFTMLLIPILQITFGTLLAKESVMILSDNIQAICMIALILEFIQYLKDEKLDWKRAIIVSLSIFCSFTSAFVSAYAIFAICLGVFLKEILYWKNRQSLSILNVIKRYWKLIISCGIPFLILLGYLILTHSLTEFYEQAFKFNTDVYSEYLEGGFGSNIFQPFFIGITNFTQIIPLAVQNIALNQNVALSIVKIVIVSSLMITLLNMIGKKKYLKTMIIILFISFSFTRTNEPFHEISAWSAIIVSLIVNLNLANFKSKLMILFVLIFTLGHYMDACTNYLFLKPEAITELEYEVINQTEEDEKIFFDIYSCPSVYLIYNNRLPINRLGFILPWYMDWYELETINDLENDKPNICLYDKELKAWEISGYDDYLQKYLKENYNILEINQKIWRKK